VRISLRDSLLTRETLDHPGHVVIPHWPDNRLRSSCLSQLAARQRTLSLESMLPDLSVVVTAREPFGLATDVVIWPVSGIVELAEAWDFAILSLERILPSLSVLVTVRVPSGFLTEFVVMPVLTSVAVAETGDLPLFSLDSTLLSLSVFVMVREPSGF
jgi:hypothetical protein